MPLHPTPTPSALLFWATAVTLGAAPFAVSAPKSKPASKPEITAKTKSNVSTTFPASTTANEGLTLEDALNIAFANEGSIGAAQEAAVGADQRITSARSSLFPQLSVGVNTSLAQGSSVSSTTTSTGGTGTGTGTGTTITTSRNYATSTQTNFGLTQNIFDGGSARAQVRQAKAGALSSQAGIGVARQSLAFEVASNFYEQLRQERLLVQRQGQVKLAEGQLAQIQAQITAGAAAPVDAQTVLVTLSQARFDLITAQNNLRTAQTTLRNSLGLTRGEPLPLRESPEVTALSQTVAPSSPLLNFPLSGAATPGGANTPQTATTVTPPDAATPATTNTAIDATTAETGNVDISDAAIDAALNADIKPPANAATGANADGANTDGAGANGANASTLPAATPGPIAVPQLASLTDYLNEARQQRPDLVQSRATVQSNEASVSIAKAARLPQVSGTAGYNLQNLYNSGRGVTAGLSLSLPLFDAGGRKADVKAAQADLEANRLRLTQLDKDVSADVEATYVRVSGTVDSLANARALVESARQNLEAATERYRQGAAIVLDVVNAQTQFAQARTSATSAIFDYQIALADLARAAGRFSTPQGTQTALAAGRPATTASSVTSKPVTAPLSPTVDAPEAPATVLTPTTPVNPAAPATTPDAPIAPAIG